MAATMITQSRGGQIPLGRGSFEARYPVFLHSEDLVARQRKITETVGVGESGRVRPCERGQSAPESLGYDR